jgi:TRAP-type C4-dicarboxylate transport system permease small subunit
MKIIKRAVRIITIAELVISAFAFILMVASYFISVVNRNIIKGSMPWTEELALYAMVYMALIGMELGLRDGTQVCVTALTDKLKGSVAGKILSIVARIILIVFVFMILQNGCSLVAKQLQTGQTSPVMKIPMYLLYLSLPVSFGITLISQVLMFIGEIFNIPMEDITAIDTIINSLFGKLGKNKGQEDK